MKKLLVFLALAIAASPASAFIRITIQDLVGGGSELFVDQAQGIPGEVVLGTPGQATITTADSSILGTYYAAGSIQSAVSNYLSADPFADLINSSINLNGIGAFDDAIVVNIAADYLQPEGDQGLATTVLNAATIQDASFDATVFVSATPLLTELDITTGDTFTDTELVDLVSKPYTITHAFRLASLADGSDLGFDISTEVVGVPTPGPLALIGLGLAGLGFTRKFF